MTHRLPDHPDRLAGCRVSDLLRPYAGSAEELRRRDVLRSASNPAWDLAEYLFARAFGWTLAANSARAHDATDPEGRRDQIKGRRLVTARTSRQVSTPRALDGVDILAAVLFDARYRVARAALIPVGVVRDKARYGAHTNSHRFMLQDNIWKAEGVADVTAVLRAAQDD